MAFQLLAWDAFTFEDVELNYSEEAIKFILYFLSSTSTVFRAIDKQLSLLRALFENYETIYKNMNRPAGVLSNKFIKYACHSVPSFIILYPFVCR